MTDVPEPAAPRAHWTNYEVTFYYGDRPEPEAARVTVTEGRETLTDLPDLIARGNREFYPDPEQIAILTVEVTCSTRINVLLAPWLRQLELDDSLRDLRQTADQATTARIIGPHARRRAEADLFAKRLREREAAITARTR